MPDKPVISRSLTSGEIALARSVFGAALQTKPILLHNGKFVPFQGRHYAITPNNNIWFGQDAYGTDYSNGLEWQSLLIHELTHCWQYQHGSRVLARGFWEQASSVFRSIYNYGELDDERPFSSYLNEQQAAIVADYFLLTHGGKQEHGTGTREQYRNLIPFLPQRPAIKRVSKKN